MWNPFQRGYSYTALREQSATLPRRFYIRTLAGLLLFSVVVLFRDLPSSLIARDPSTRGLRTAILGGVPGYLVFENVWYNNHTFYLYNPDADLPDSDGVLSRPGYIAHAAQTPSLVPDVCFAGTSLVVNENGWSGWHGLWHYYHFAAENIVAGFAALAQAGLFGVPDHLVIPWENNWHDRFGMNEMVIKGLWGMNWEGYVSPDNWRELGRDGPQWFFFERVAIVDRWVTHKNNPSADQWNKMPMPILEMHPSDDFFVPARQRFLESYGIHPPSRTVPEVLYIDRQNTDRRLDNATHNALLELMQDLAKGGRFEFKHVELEDLTPREQIEVVAYADVMVGIHGNGLTHEMWMPQRSTLIELFHPTSFLRDYECIGTAIGHHYYAVRNDTVLTPAQWEAHPGEQHSNLMHDGTPISLHLPFFRTVMEEALARYE